MPAQLISEFDIWRQGYDEATVTVFVGGTTALANIFSDEALTVPVVNPLVLLKTTDQAGGAYGKFATPLYTASPYFLKIENGEETGIKRPPLANMNGVDISLSMVTVGGSSFSNVLSDIIGRTVYAENYGEIIKGGSTGSAATNTTTIEAAIGALGTSGIVHLPAGVIRINAISLPAGVILEGEGNQATTLQIISAGNAFTITGDNAGFRDLTLDGNNLTTGSHGVYALNRSFLLFENFTAKNFDIGLTFKGGGNPQWENFSILNCNIGAEIHGDKDAGNTNTGGSFLGGRWNGGQIFACSNIGADLKYVDAIVAHLAIENVYFNSNIGTAVRIKGAQFEPLNNCRWSGNHVNIDISDDATVLTPATQYQNKVAGITISGGVMNGGIVQMTGNADDVVLEHLKLLGVTFNLVSPLNNDLILRDCFENSGTIITGNPSRLVRQFQSQDFEITGVTTGNLATRAWGITLEDNQVAYFEVDVIGVQRNGTNRAIYHAVCGARRGVGTLNYQAQTANYTLGDTLTGANSGATARIVADSDSGATGTLSLGAISGTFVNGEIITGNTTGSANVNGTITDGTHAVDGVGLVHLRTPYETDSAWDISFAFSAGEVAFQVQGNTSQTVDWTVRIKLVTS